MRRTEKKTILELLDTIGEAHKEYKKYKKDNDMQRCIEVLTACQESAVSIGNAIEKSEGNGTGSVRLLEKYCEDLYQLSRGMNGISIDTDLINIRNSINEEIQVVLEVVFFPYKASMWDSMESIYLAFRKREDVNVYLVPIPYYNRKNDGTVDNIHCESDLFPKDEPVTDWEAFDVAKIKPDIAFIHNPYDDLNFVTTVDPRFYSFELKKNVDCLLYCPYYSTVGMIPKGQSLCKGYLYADCILTQSEYQMGFYDKSIPRTKFLPMGSPKFDKVIRLNNERITNPDKFNSRIPLEWQNKRAGKTVYFFNTSITGILANTQIFLDKMNYVFDVFLHEKNAILFWRPHPLSEETFKALRPEFYDSYLRIQERFINENIGIIDRTPDVSVSAAFCDAFIGDSGTSITSLFVVMGKPLFILNDIITAKAIDRDVDSCLFQIPFADWQNGYIITEGNRIFKCEYPLQNTIRFHYVNKISDYKTQMYSLCCKYGRKYYLTPLRTEDIAVFEDGTFTHIKLKHCTDQANKFVTTVVCDKYIFLIPNEYYYIVRLDMESEKVTYTDDLRNIFISEDQNFNRKFGGCCLFHNHLYIGSTGSNKVLLVNIETLEHKVISIGEDSENGCVGFAYIPQLDNVEYCEHESLIVLPYKGTRLRRFYPNTGKVKYYDIHCEGFFCSEQDHEEEHDNIFPFSSMIMDKGILYIAPYRGNKFIKLNTVTGKSKEYKFPLSIDWQPHSRYFTGGYKGSFAVYNDKNYWISGTQRRFYEIELNETECKIVKEIPVEFDADEVRAHANGFCVTAPWWTQYGLQEDAINSLSSFISGKVYGAPFDKQKELDSFKNVSVNLDGTCGQKVCDFLMKKMEL